jgi:hydroxymethylglutaryl-CoA reductase (NADPH)
MIHDSLDNFTHYLTHQLSSSGARKYPSLCYRPMESILADGTTPVPCFTAQSHNARTLTHTLTFLPGARDEFVGALNRQSKFNLDDSSVRFVVDNRQTEAIGQMKSGKWIAYAIWALALRFWDLAKA